MTEPLSFDEALEQHKAALAAMDASRPRPWAPPDPHLLARFHATGLEVRRAIHRDHPTLYGDPDA